ncbi:MAG: MFS transporter [Planctomycetota bacterium]|nr:MFS transporter [Planctomycetota bacterium]
MAIASDWRARTFASFARPAFRAYYVGLLCNMAGFWLRIAATGWLAFELTDSREALGIIAVASLLPWVPIAPLAGVWAERVDQRRYLVVIYVAIAAANGALAAGLALGWVGWPELVAATVATAILRGMELPARHAIVRRTVELPLLANAIGLNAAGFHLMNAVGFALAGVIYQHAGPAACFVAVACASLGMAFVLGRIELAAQAYPEERRSPLRELAEGFAYVGGHGVTRVLVLCALGVVILLLSFRTLMPAIIKVRLGLGADDYGGIMAISGAGSLLAALWVASGSGGAGRRVINIFVTVWLGCAAVALVGWTSSVVWMGVAMFVAGFAHVGFMASANTTVQELVPDHLRARVMGIWALVFGAAFPLGGYLQGLVAEHYGERWAVIGGAGLALVLSAVLYATGGRRLNRRLGEGIDARLHPPL